MHDDDHTQTGYGLRDYVFDEPCDQLFIVGDLPQKLTGKPANGVSIHILDSLDEAEQQTVQEPTGDASGNHTARALILMLSPDAPRFEEYIGRAVRLFPHRILLHCTVTDASPGWADDDFFAFGFKKLNIARDDSLPEETVKWFEYRLSEYKPAPDWLNARYWANPDRFELDGDLDDYCDEPDDDDEEE